MDYLVDDFHVDISDLTFLQVRKIKKEFIPPNVLVKIKSKAIQSAIENDIHVRCYKSNKKICIEEEDTVYLVKFLQDAKLEYYRIRIQKRGCTSCAKMQCSTCPRMMFFHGN